MSNSAATQIKVTLPQEISFRLKSKAESLGLGLSSYIRHLVINDVKALEIPTFKMSERREKIALKALEDYKKGKTRTIKDWDKYMSGLTSE